mgnify:CR=1 FL=1
MRDFLMDDKNINIKKIIAEKLNSDAIKTKKQYKDFCEELFQHPLIKNNNQYIGELKMLFKMAWPEEYFLNKGE